MIHRVHKRKKKENGCNVVDLCFSLNYDTTHIISDTLMYHWGVVNEYL